MLASTYGGEREEERDELRVREQKTHHFLVLVVGVDPAAEGEGWKGRKFSE